MKRFIVPAILAMNAVLRAAGGSLPEKIEFNRDVRPILSENCFKCHGFDEKKREAKRRIDTREGALADNDGVRAIVPGSLAESEVHARIHSTDKDEQMPPLKSGKKLDDRQRAIIDRWIEQGAGYEPHWAYAPLVRPAVPESNADTPVRSPSDGTADRSVRVTNPIDSLVRARLARIGLAPSPEADPRTLIRRLSLDLTGLPPTPSEVDAFAAAQILNPKSEILNLADRLLASPAYGERMAVFWLDLVRYADSIGFHSDNPRNVSPFRDCTIRAFNENKRFDQFTIEQIAGDLLPEATLWQRVASGYNRLIETTEEGGAQAKDYEARSVTDRVRSIGTTWLALTTGCCQCHDHKFDPITTRDFYRLGAFFADIQESAIGRRESGMPVPTPEQSAKLKELTAAASARQTKLDAPSPELDAAQSAWEKSTLAAMVATGDWTPLHPVEMTSEAGAQITVEDGEVIRSSGGPDKADVYRIVVKTSAPNVTGFRLEALASSRLPGRGPGRAHNGNFVLTEFSADALKFANASATFEQPTFSAGATIDGKIGERGNGWAVLGATGADSAIYFQLAQPLAGEGEKTVTFTLRFDYGTDHSLGKFRLSATGAPGPIAAPKTAAPPEILSLLKIDSAQRNDGQRAKLAKHFRTIAPELAPLRAQLAKAQKQRDAFDKTIARCLVSTTMPKPRVVRVLPRGNWLDESGEVVEPGVPAFLPQPKIEGRKLTRLDLAQWIVSPENPLTARVFVNRVWKMFFGTGLSKVLDDAGAQGEPPVNPELLDWLAADFIESGWDVKHLVRRIVTSETYRQTSTPSKELRERDPFNREVACQSRFRLDAEFVRDNALAISGLLVQRIGGPSVSPYQPAGYWENLSFPTREWQASTDDDQWRRGLYTWWQRSYMHPSLLAFDAPSREECVAERVRSNIPQQALAMLNDPTYVEAARAFAARILRECSGDAASRVAWAFRQALGREPRADEAATIGALLAKHSAIYAGDPEAAAAILKTGLAPLPKDANASELAAWTSVARVILNLHETITRM